MSKYEWDETTRFEQIEPWDFIDYEHPIAFLSAYVKGMNYTESAKKQFFEDYKVRIQTMLSDCMVPNKGDVYWNLHHMSNGGGRSMGSTRLLRVQRGPEKPVATWGDPEWMDPADSKILITAGLVRTIKAKNRELSDIMAQIIRIGKKRVQSMTKPMSTPSLTPSEQKEMRTLWLQLVEAIEEAHKKKIPFTFMGLGWTSGRLDRVARYHQTVHVCVHNVLKTYRNKLRRPTAEVFYARTSEYLQNISNLFRPGPFREGIGNGNAEKQFPWETESWWVGTLGHYVHDLQQSANDPMMLSYYRGSAGYKQGVRTVLKPGRYLSTFYGGVLTEVQIRNWTNAYTTFVKGHTLHLTPLTTAENEKENKQLWVNVYRSGLKTCMTGNDAVKVYARPGNRLRLAYITANDAPITKHDPGKVIARCIVRDDNGTWLRAYPDDRSPAQTEILALLAKAGYVNRGNLVGVRLDLTPSDAMYTIVCPYIDHGNSEGAQRLSVVDSSAGACLEVQHGGGIDGTGAQGTVKVHQHVWARVPGAPVPTVTYQCSCCGGEKSIPGRALDFYKGAMVCESCINQHFVLAHSFGNVVRLIPKSHSIQYGGEYDYFDYRAAPVLGFYQCDVSGRFFPKHLLVCVGKLLAHRVYVTTLSPLFYRDLPPQQALLTETVCTMHNEIILRKDAIVIQFEDDYDGIPVEGFIHLSENPEEVKKHFMTTKNKTSRPDWVTTAPTIARHPQ